MLNIFRWTALGALVLFVVAVAGAIVSSPTPNPTNQTQTPKDQTENSQKENPKTYWDTWFPESISLYTFVLVVFTGVLAFGGIYQLRFLLRAEAIAAQSSDAAKQAADATTDAVTVARNSAARELRPYVWLEIGATIYQGDPLKAPDRYAIQLTVMNSGKSWARNLRIRHARATDPTGDPFDIATLNASRTSPIILGPGQTINLQFGDIPLTDLRHIETGSLKIFYTVWVTYDDAMTDPPTQRQTQLFMQLAADTEGVGHVSFGFMPIHNCADEDCPK